MQIQHAISVALWAWISMNITRSNRLNCNKYFTMTAVSLFASFCSLSRVIACDSFLIDNEDSLVVFPNPHLHRI